MRSILIVDDEKHTRDGLVAALSDKYDVACAANADEAARLMEAQPFDAVVTDLRMSGKSGLALIEEAVRRPEKPACIMMTAYGNIDVAVEAMKHGASDFLTKPINIDRLELVLMRALGRRDEEAKQARAGAARPSAGASARPEAPGANYGEDESGIIASSPQMMAVIAQAKKVAASRATVMLTGETGTGKELVARFIHKNSPRAGGPFVPVHCAAIPENLLESELFGYEKGAFTGAAARKPGRFESANAGTLFLDEIGEIDAPTQVKLLRFLETRSVERLGGVGEIPVDARLVCATNRDLKEMAARGRFREDLYYRLNVVEIKLPPLRDRPGDIPPLVSFYIEKYARENGAGEISVSREAMKILSAYPWPGNIRELRNFCENAVVLRSGDTISAEDLDPRFSSPAQALPQPSEYAPAQFPIAPTLSRRENDMALIMKALGASGGNKTKAAQMLGISRRTLHRKLEEERLRRDGGQPS